jgi:lysophospholipase L1-like esterase
MKSLRSFASHALALALLTPTLWAQAPAAKAPPLPPQKPDVAAPKLGPDGQPNAAFIKAHEGFVKIAQEGQTRLLFLGDSITAGWGRQKQTWDTAFGKYQPANFGIGGDRTQHVLWRIQNGELDGIKPKAAVLMIGTNNSGTDSAEGIADGVKAIIKTLHAKSPQTKVLLLAIFPRGDKPDGKFGAAQEKLKQVNGILSRLHDGKKVFYLDIGEKFLVNGVLTAEIMPDFLHLSAKGYQIWADAITPKLAELMK